MTDMPYEQDEYGDNDSQPNWRRKLEADAKAGKEATARAEAAETETKALQQELAMRRAGLDPESPQAQMFSKANPGLADVDTIKSEWEKVFPAGSQRPPADMAALQRISEASNGGIPVGGAPVDFGDELDAIPIVVDGGWNPNYVSQVLSKTQEQAAREGREFGVDRSSARFERGTQQTPNTAPLHK